MRVVPNGHTKALAAEHQPDHAQLPILKAVQVRMRTIVEIDQGAFGDQVFAATITGGKQERNVGDLLGENIDRAIHPRALLIRIGKDGPVQFFALQPILDRISRRGALDDLGLRLAAAFGSRGATV